MKLIRALKWTALLSVTLVAGPAFADQWLPASTKQYVSADGAWRLTVEPRPITSPLRYFQDQVASKPRPGGLPGQSQTSAIGTMERRVNGTWQRVWQKPLRNTVAPVTAIALPGGAAMTLDNWHSMGFGPDAVVLYNQQGVAVAAYALTDFLPKPYVQALPRTVSSLGWRGEPKALPDGKRVAVPVLVPSEDGDMLAKQDEKYVRIIFDLAAGKVERPSGPAWKQAEQAALKARAHQLRAHAEERQRFIAPLRAPTSTKEDDWHAYLIEAFFRLDRGWKDDYPETTVLRAPGAANYRASVAWVHDALRGEDREGPIMLASPSQEALLARIEAEAKGVQAGALSKARLYLVLDDAGFARAKRALAHARANLIQIDPATAIPQRPERQAGMQAREAEDD